MGAEPHGLPRDESGPAHRHFSFDMGGLTPPVDPGAFLAALLFAIHPVNLQVAAWISQRKEILAALFFVLSILWYVRYQKSRKLGAVTMTPGTRHWYWFSLSAFALAILSKGSVGTLPLVLLLIVWWLHGRITKRDIVQSLPFFCVGLVVSLLHVWSQMHGDPIAHASFSERLSGAGAVVWFYLASAFLPINLSAVYPQWLIRTGDLRWWLPLLAAVAVSGLLWWHRRRGWVRPLLLVWCYCCFALVPVVGFAETGGMKISLVADHCQHLALIGVVALVAAGCAYFHQHTTVRRWAKMPAIVLVGCLAMLGWHRSSLFGNSVLLFQDSLTRNPQSWLVHTNLAIALGKTGRTQEALEHCRQADRFNPDSPLVHHNWGVQLFDAGRFPEAIEQFRQTLRLMPDSDNAHRDLATALFAAGQQHEATEQFALVLRGNPENAQSHYELGVALAKTGRLREGIEQFQEAIRLKPIYPEAHNNLGSALLDAGQISEAVEQFQQAIQLQPEYVQAYANLTIAYARLNRHNEAIIAGEKAASLARSSGNTMLAQQIEAWLAGYRSQQTNQ